MTGQQIGRLSLSDDWDPDGVVGAELDRLGELSRSRRVGLSDAASTLAGAALAGGAVVGMASSSGAFVIVPPELANHPGFPAMRAELEAQGVRAELATTGWDMAMEAAGADVSVWNWPPPVSRSSAAGGLLAQYGVTAQDAAKAAASIRDMVDLFQSMHAPATEGVHPTHDVLERRRNQHAPQAPAHVHGRRHGSRW